MRRVLAAACLSLCLAGCASVPNPLSADAIKSLRMTDIQVTIAPDAEMWWGNAEREYMATYKAPAGPVKQRPIETASLSDRSAGDAADETAIINSPECKAYVRDKAASRLKTALEVGVKPAVQSGARPVRLEVTVHAFTIPSAVQRVALGGTPIVKATAVIKDAATGEVILSRPEMLAAANAGQGWAGVLLDQMGSDLDQRVVDAYATDYRHWLLSNT